MSNTIRIIGICGSLRPKSYTYIALKIALSGAEKAGATIQLLNLRDYNLVFFDGGEDEEKYPTDVFRLRADVQLANGIILATPEYHGYFSGFLKNTLDLMGYEEFQSKLVALIGVAGGPTGATNSLNALRIIGRQLHAWVLPEQVSISWAAKVFDQKGNIVDNTITQQLILLGEQLVTYVSLFKSEKLGDFIKLWENASENPGENSQDQREL